MLRTERILDAFAPAIAVPLVFVAASLLGAWALVPWWLHAVGLAAVVGVWAWTLRRGRRRFQPPTADDVDRRLEMAAGLRHRPIEALTDRPAGAEEAGSRGLWAAHQERQRTALAQLRFIALAPVLTRRDPWALRAALVLVLIVAVVDAGPAWRSRLLAAVTPAPAGATVELPTRVDLWVTPPGYTDEPPIVHSLELPVAEAIEPLVVPAGSELVVQLHEPGVDEPPAPEFALEPLATERLGPGSVEARTDAVFCRICTAR